MDLNKNSEEEKLTKKRGIIDDNNLQYETPNSSGSQNIESQSLFQKSLIEETKQNDSLCFNDANKSISCVSDSKNPEKSTEINSLQICNLVEVQNSSDNLNSPLCSSTEPRDNTKTLQKNVFSIDDSIAALIFLTIKLRHNLTYVATQDFVRGMSVLNDSTVVKATKYHWKKIVDSFSDPITIHHLCPTCGSYLGEQKYVNYGQLNLTKEVSSRIDNNSTEENIETFHCNNCNKDINIESNYQSGNIFSYFSLGYQLKELFENSTFHKDLKHPLEKKNKYAFEDIIDGNLYKKIVDCDMISITFNTDGVPVFDSSNCTAYPILCSINELHPLKRKKKVLLVALWVGTGKPQSLQEFFKPFVSEAEILYQKGFNYNYEGQTYTKKCCVVLSINDALVRPKLRNSMQFNGQYGCGLCLNAGKRIDKGRGNVNIYPIEANNAYGEGLRTYAETIRHAAQRKKGIKGDSVLSYIPRFDIILGIDVDWMHCVGLGVCRQFAKLWFDSANSDEDFYLGLAIEIVDDLLLSYKPTSDMSRTTRKMSERSYWKAHEWIAFLLFYSLPVLQVVAEKKYLNHWALLIDGISLLIQTSVMPSDIHYAHNSLIGFINGVNDLYGEKELSFNVHSLSHLAQSVKNWGPLWAHDCFTFENFNQEILESIQSSNGVAHQIYDRFRTKCVVTKLNNILSEDLSHQQKQFIDELLGNEKKLNYTQIIDNVKLLGQPRVLQLTREQFLAFQRRRICIEEKSIVQHYDRAVIDHQVIHSNLYERCKKRNNRCVKLSNDEIFEIESFVLTTLENKTSCYAVGWYFEKINEPFIVDRKLQHMHKLRDRLNCLGIAYPSEIVERVTLLPIHNTSDYVACVHPNRFHLIN
ncbi:uncharacterized protein LOC130676372 [Microplitis mediator]|uniref:uncharacterized protein LOC130676372 n=1 Tax=Microplitis mediator TaxID=375433 RepID=UPI0025528F4C|nr:uncharacterized protein LOC130676372 [Microplitis mediator]